MQNFSNTAQRNSASSAGINSKVSVPAKKGGTMNTSEDPVKAGKGAPKGFAGGLINPKIGAK